MKIQIGKHKKGKNKGEDKTKIKKKRKDSEKVGWKIKGRVKNEMKRKGRGEEGSGRVVKGEKEGGKLTIRDLNPRPLFLLFCYHSSYFFSSLFFYCKGAMHDL